MSTIIIAGASQGIGEATAIMLAERGHDVIALSRSGTSKNHPNIKSVKVDISAADNLPDIDKVDGIMYCPGSIDLKPFKRLNVSAFQADMEVNFLWAIPFIQKYLEPLQASGNGSVVMFSTVAVSQGMPFHSSISAAKGAVEGFVRSLAAELAPKVRVNCIAPSITDTPLAGRLLSGDARREAAAKRHALQRFGSSSDIAHMARFLLEEESSWITGQVLHVDGGMSSLRLV